MAATADMFAAFARSFGIVTREALSKLRVYESLAHDLNYALDDPRGAMPDSEMPPEWHETRGELQSRVTYAAARLAGERHDDAKAFSDVPTSIDNPYSIDRVRFAASLKWRLSRECR